MHSRDENYIVALDIGSNSIRTVIAQIITEEEKPRVVGVGIARSEGMRKGSVVDIEEVSKSVLKSINEAELNSGVKVEGAFVSIGGTHISCLKTKGVIAIGRADGEVAREDIDRVLEASQAVNLPPNQEILHIIPQNYRLDDQEDIKDPIGMSGVRLEMNGLVITGSSAQIKNITKCINNAGINVEGFVIAPLAAAKAVLNKRQKELGVALIEIGGGTTSMAVYEEGELLHVAVLPVGASHITNDIAIGLRTSIDVAEQVKLQYGSALANDINKKDQIDLSAIDKDEEGMVSRRHVAEIIEARAEEVFYIIEKELKKINRSALLPAGAVLVGGGACMQGMVDLSKNILALPAQTGFPRELSGLTEKVDNPTFSVCVGVILWAMEEESLIVGGDGGFNKNNIMSKLLSIKDLVKIVRDWFSKFLP